jgi:hypothetical protein
MSSLPQIARPRRIQGLVSGSDAELGQQSIQFTYTNTTSAPTARDTASFFTIVSTSLSHETQSSAAAYAELGAALTDLHGLDDHDDWKIDEGVYGRSVQIAAALMHRSIPRPSVFSHGPKSVVFNWTHAGDSVYLTITEDKLYALISSPQRITYRAEFPSALTRSTDNFISALGSAQLSTPPTLEYQASPASSGS